MDADIKAIVDKVKAAVPAASAEEAERRIVRARVGLLFDSPFFGTLALRLRLECGRWQPTMAVDMKRLVYHPDFVAELTDAELMGVVAHEVMHCVFEHPLRRRDRQNDIWQRAIDYVVNDVVMEAKFTLPPSALFDPDYRGMTADAIYERLLKEQPQKPQEQGPEPDGDGDNDDEQEGKDNGDGKGKGKDKPGQDKGKAGQGRGKGKGDKDKPGKDKGGERTEAQDPDDADEEEHEGEDGGEAERPDPGMDPARCGGTLDAEDEETGDALNESEAKKLANEWKVATAQAAVSAKSAGQLPGSLRRVVEDIVNPKVDWKELLRRFLDQFSKDDYSWKVPNRRHIANGDYLPSLRSESMKEIIVVVDTSASIDAPLIKAALAEIEAIGGGAAAPVRVLYCDYIMQGEEEFGPYDRPIDLKRKFPGGGGTSFQPPFAYVEQKHYDPSVLIYITDMQCSSFPRNVPEYPVLWLQTTQGWGRPQFGEIIKAF